MTANTKRSPSRHSRRTGVAAGAALATVLLSLTSAPAAHADDPCLGPFCLDTGTTTMPFLYQGVLPGTETTNFFNLSAGPLSNDFSVDSLAASSAGVGSFSANGAQDVLAAGSFSNIIDLGSSQVSSNFYSETSSSAHDYLNAGPINNNPRICC